MSLRGREGQGTGFKKEDLRGFDGLNLSTFF
jgi:hypothetical protein